MTYVVVTPLLLLAPPEGDDLVPNAADGAVGVRMTSHSWNARAKSWTISARTRCALVK